MKDFILKTRQFKNMNTVRRGHYRHLPWREAGGTTIYMDQAGMGRGNDEN
jgi:environmental stress-induced protein Ves